MNILMLPLKVDLQGGWSDVWSALKGAVGPSLTNILTIAGVVIVVLALIGWLWKRRRNLAQQGGHAEIAGAFMVGALLLAPEVIIPILLWLADGIINTVIAIVENTGAGK